MIGRQRIYVDPARLQQLADVTSAETTDRYADWLFRRLGAELVDSVDVSSYEGATILHDLNTPIPEHLHGRFSLVFEAGTLEHIFNFPVAIRNCMDLLAPGGHLVCCTGTNNFCGHGFYQFSPELFWRVLAEENGFVVERMIACDAFRESEWYDVADPATVRHRVEIVGPYSVMLMVRARKISARQPFGTIPQQSDYGVVWTDANERHQDHQPPEVARGITAFIRKLSSDLLFRTIRRVRSERQYAPDVFHKARD